MAGDWIKIRKSLAHDPRVIRISSALKADRLRTIGGLVSAWCLLDEQTEDGKLDGYSPEVFDEIVGFPGLCRSMAAVNWLEIGDGFLAAPRFEEHNGHSAKRRAQDSFRKNSTRKAEICPRHERTKSGPEKRREEYKENTVAPAPALPFESPEFAGAWTRWLSYNREKKKKMPATTTLLQLKKLAKFGEHQAIAAIEASMENNWTGLFEAKPSKPAIRPTSEPSTMRSLYD